MSQATPAGSFSGIGSVAMDASTLEKLSGEATILSVFKRPETQNPVKSKCWTPHRLHLAFAGQLNPKRNHR